MFDTVSQGFQKAFSKFRSKSKLTEENIQEGLREVRQALLAADVNLVVVKNFINSVKDQAIGQSQVKDVHPGQQIIKIVSDELVKLMGEKEAPLEFNRVNKKGPSVFMVAGLQGAGKTTTCGKLASRLKKEGKKVLMAAADVQRPAAIEQLKTLGQTLGIPVYSEDKGKPVRICQRAVKQANAEGLDVVILDTAGRLHVDQELMKEVTQISKKTSPDEILLVADAMTGQDAVNSAKAFDDALPLTGLILTKLDGDARGGAAMSIRAVTGKPVKFVGMGEDLEALEPFYPDRMASRILGMGDVVTLVEKAQAAAGDEDMEDMASRMMGGKLTMQDVLKQMKMIKRMGSLGDIMKMMPGMGNMMQDIDPEEASKELKKVEAMISSMTPHERMNPELLKGRRRVRICRGSGTSSADMNQLTKQFKMMQKMGKQFGQMAGGGKMPKMPKIPGFKLPKF